MTVPRAGVWAMGAVAVLAGLGLVYGASRGGRYPKQEKPMRPSSVGRPEGTGVTVLTNEPHMRAAEALAEWFQDETGVIVRNVVVNYGEALDYTVEDVRSASPRLDVVMFWYVDLGALVEREVLTDLTAFIEENRSRIDPDDFIPSLYDPYTLFEGRRWALPFDGDTHVLFYRKSVLRKHALNPPETWDDYLHVARTITEAEKSQGMYGTALMARAMPIIVLSSFVNRLGGYGGRLLDANGEPDVASEEGVAALTAMVDHTKYALPTPSDTDWEVSRDAFLSGRAAMVEQWTDLGVMAEDPNQSIIQGDWGVVQMPRGKGPGAGHPAALNAGFSLGVSRRAPNPDAARAYLLFANRPDIALRLNLINGGMDPTRYSVLESAAYQEAAPGLSAAVRKALERATPWPTTPEAPQLLDVLAANVIMAIEKRMTPRQALENTQEQWRGILHQ